jgi:hypothetical protein
MAGRVVLLWAMNATLPDSNDILHAPDPFRDALAELVGIGMSVARMIRCAAETETALALAAAEDLAMDGVSPMPNSLAEAIEADRAAAAAGEARRTVVARTQAVAGAFAEVSRAIRRTVLLAERIDRGWAQRPMADDQHAMAKRQIERGVRDAIEREADGSRAEACMDALAERMDRPETLDEIGLRSAEDIIRMICGELKLGLAKMRGEAPLLLPLPRAGEGRGEGAIADASPGLPAEAALTPALSREEREREKAGEGGATPSILRPPRDRTSPHR